MAKITMRTCKDGSISYLITVSYGKDGDGKKLRHHKTYKPPATWKEDRGYKQAVYQAGIFEAEIKKGFEIDNKWTFRDYAKYVLEIKRREGVRESTIESYEDLLTRINPEIGHVKLTDLRPAHLNALYTKLGKAGGRLDGNKAVAKGDLKADLKSRKITQKALAEKSGVSINTIALASHGQRIEKATADKLAAALEEKTERLFTVETDTKPLSDKTILEHHRLISTILAQAEKEMLVPYNAAEKATPPKPKRPEPNYFQPETVYDILDAVETEPLKYRLFVNMLAVTGCRRGELAGLKWSKIDMATRRITIDSGLYYSKSRGVYQGDTKTGEHRTLTIPKETIALLKEYRADQIQLRFKNGDRWKDQDYVFTQDNGLPTTPDSWTRWLNRFSERKGLPHINPHAFRHTVASVLISKGVDITTVSGMLGHSSVATTEDYYAHIIEKAKEQASETLTDVLIKRNA